MSFLDKNQKEIKVGDILICWDEWTNTPISIDEVVLNGSTLFISPILLNPKEDSSCFNIKDSFPASGFFEVGSPSTGSIEVIPESRDQVTNKLFEKYTPAASDGFFSTIVGVA
jgi:hypothetical protein